MEHLRLVNDTNGVILETSYVIYKEYVGGKGCSGAVKLSILVLISISHSILHDDSNLIGYSDTNLSMPFK